MSASPASAPGKWERRLAPFRRITSSGKFIPEIDGLRFVAISTVFLYHLNGYLLAKGGPFAGNPANGWLSQSVDHGRYGVQLFFVISGFILGLPFASHHLIGARRVSLRAYFLRRLTRLEPPYVLCLLLFFAMLVVLVRQSPASLAPHLAASTVYLHNLIYAAESAINPVAWSLEVEIQFYVLVPFLAGLFAIKSQSVRRLTMAAILVVMVALQSAFISHHTPRLELSILNQIQYFLVGFLLADVYLTEWQSHPRTTLWWDVVSLVVWPALPFLWRLDTATHWLFPPAVFVLYCAAFRGTWSRRVFANVWIATIGGMCYTIYLLHYQIISFVGRLSLNFRISDRYPLEFVWQFLLVTPLVLAVCAIYFVLIEKPCMRPDWPARLSARLRVAWTARRTA